LKNVCQRSVLCGRTPEIRAADGGWRPDANIADKDAESGAVPVRLRLKPVAGAHRVFCDSIFYFFAEPRPEPRKRIEGYKGRPLVMRLIRPAWLDEGHEDEAEAKLKRRQGETRDLYKDQER
jgi:hypothetical protein